MRSLAPTTALLLSALLLLPTAASAQDIIEPPLPPPCDIECWWPAGQVAQLDAIEADIEVTDGKSRGALPLRPEQPGRSTIWAVPAPRAASSSRSRPAAR